MLNQNKRKSIFYILIIRIFIFVLIFSAIQTTYLIKKEINVQKKKMEERSSFIKNEIESILAFIRADIGSVDKYYALAQNQVLNQIIANTKNQNIKEINLNNILNKIHVDTLEYDFSIIKDSVIINSSNKQDIGLHFIKHLNKENKSLFMQSKNKGNANFSYMDFDPETLRFKVFNYSISNNGILYELSNYSSIFDKSLNYLKDRLKIIEESYADIDYLDFWIHTKNDALSFSDTHNDYIGKFIKKQSFVLDTLLSDNNIRIEHYYHPARFSSDQLAGISLSIIYNIDIYNQLIYDLIKSRIQNTLIYFIILIFIIFFATRSLKLTLADLLKKTAIISSGNLRERVKLKGNNEFTTLAEQFNSMVERLEHLFSDIKQRNEEITAQRDEIEMQKDYEIKQKELIESQNQHIVDSIDYAKQIQQAALPDINYIKKILPEHLIFFKPRDIVSGDFYWINKIDKHLIIAAVDCTGHGVPGAFMSMLGISLLNDIVEKKKITQVDQILNELRAQVKSSLKQGGQKNQNRDGMDIAMCSIDTEHNTMQFAGAYNPLILIRDNEIIEFRADRMPIGVHLMEKSGFTKHEIAIQKNDQFYLYSDGFPDQFGGSKRRKFMSKNFKKLLLEISKYKFDKQEQLLNEKLDTWMGETEQTDDIIIIGFKIR